MNSSYVIALISSNGPCNIISRWIDTGSVPAFRLVHGFKRADQIENNSKGDEAPNSHLHLVLNFVNSNNNGYEQQPNKADGEGDNKSFSSILFSCLK